jgi:aspartyl-tRNA(Asn)/glutamyl-tRNA(Gln) amidotransferase subunit C
MPREAARKLVDETTVRRIARLARIKITDNEAVALEGELNGILQWIEQLDEVDTDGVEPMTRVVPVEMKKRVDQITDGSKADDIVGNAPMKDGPFFMVPKVVE